MRARKKYGQHFLEPAWADRLVEAIAPRSGDRFLEIGPGPGVLDVSPGSPGRGADGCRDRSADGGRAGASRAIERDDRRAPTSSNSTSPAAAGGSKVRVAGNLPYNVSSPILFRLLAAHRACGCLVDATLMLQREVAERIRASPGSRDYGVLSILIQLHADVRPLLNLPPGAFRPAPKVHSAVVALTFRAAGRRSVGRGGCSRRWFDRCSPSGARCLGTRCQRFAEQLGWAASDALARADIDPRRRPETLQLTEMARLAEVFGSS